MSTSKVDDYERLLRQLLQQSQVKIDQKVRKVAGQLEEREKFKG